MLISNASEPLIHHTYRTSAIPPDILAAWGPPETDWPRTIEQPLSSVRGQVQDDLGNFDQRAADQERVAYDGARALVPDGTTIKAPQLLSAVKSKIAEMKAVPNSQFNPQLAYFSSLARQLKKGSFTPQGLRDLRTGIYQNITDQAAARKTWGQLAGPLSQDIQNGLRGQGLNDAADAFQAADAAHGPLMGQRADVDRIMGKANNTSDEGVGSRLSGMLNNNTGDAERFSRTLSVMDPDNASRTRAALLKGMGRTRTSAERTASEIVGASRSGWCRRLRLSNSALKVRHQGPIRLLEAGDEGPVDGHLSRNLGGRDRPRSRRGG